MGRYKISSRAAAAIIRGWLMGNPSVVQPEQVTRSSLRYNREKIKAEALAKHREENTHIECIGFDGRTEKGCGQKKAETHLTILYLVLSLQISKPQQSIRPIFTRSASSCKTCTLIEIKWLQTHEVGKMHNARRLPVSSDYTLVRKNRRLECCELLPLY
ncbi:hypothetical protein Ciccas_014526 [Cichlidogyrus casuarinus]|uniref:Uncharacterized protein n=1 Tax=Cichlidogyrus casuarinus TaxID=1844966 RepID=A0ABD2PI57_9PLAT